MAGIIWAYTSPEIALVAATEKTVAQIIAATNTRVKVLKWGIFFDGISPTAEPCQVRVLRQTSAIGGSPTAVTLVAVNVITETIQTTSAYSAGGAEPSAGAVLDVKEIHPQSGYEIIFPLNQEIIVPGAGRLGIAVTAPSGVNCRCVIWGEE